MLKLTSYNGRPILVNREYIQYIHVDNDGDSCLVMRDGTRMIVKEPIDYLEDKLT